jgi:hypothetical protein
VDVLVVEVAVVLVVEDEDFVLAVSSSLSWVTMQYD